MDKTHHVSFLVLVLFILTTLISASSPCEYNNLKTKIDSPYYEEGIKIEYKDEQFVMLSDPKTIKNLEQLKGLECLEYADFYYQNISGDLENLKNLKALKVLSLHTNPEITGDVCIFGDATKLKSLKFAFNVKVDGTISCLSKLNLETFAMTYTNISGDLSDLSHMSNLKALYISGTNIVGNVSALSNLINLEELTLTNAVENGSRFYGDLAALDNLTKLKKVSLYNMDVINCGHFHEVHRNIEGGCSEESASTIIDPNVESEKIIGKQTEVFINNSEQVGQNGKERPPEECMVNGQFIGDEKCKALFDKNPRSPSTEQLENESLYSNNYSQSKPTLQEKNQTNTSNKIKELSEQKKPLIDENLLQKFINWLISSVSSFFR